MELLQENERGANIASAKVMRITAAIFVLVLILDIVGIFQVKLGVLHNRHGPAFYSYAYSKRRKAERSMGKICDRYLCSIIYCCYDSDPFLSCSAAVCLSHCYCKPVFFGQAEYFYFCCHRYRSICRTDTGILRTICYGR